MQIQQSVGVDVFQNAINRDINGRFGTAVLVRNTAFQRFIQVEIFVPVAGVYLEKHCLASGFLGGTDRVIGAEFFRAQH